MKNDRQSYEMLFTILSPGNSMLHVLVRLVLDILITVLKKISQPAYAISSVRSQSSQPRTLLTVHHPEPTTGVHQQPQATTLIPCTYDVCYKVTDPTRIPIDKNSKNHISDLDDFRSSTSLINYIFINRT